MATGITALVAEWAAGLRYEDLPASVLDKSRLQVASVLGATFAGARSSIGQRVQQTAKSWGSGESSLIPSGERVSTHAAAFANAACSVAFDYDDYLFAGHTGHSAVLGALALGEAIDASGRDVLVAQIAANEAAGRLGGALLLGPHNGQMWAMIHALGGAIAGASLMKLSADRTAHAIGIALAQPPYPLNPAFFGPDSKALIASGPLVDGLRAASLAEAGLTGADDVIGDRGGILNTIATRPLPFAFTGLGSAWVTDSLTFKLFPGCAYVDTPVEAFDVVRTQFAQKHGRPVEAGDVERVVVEGTMFTDEMEKMSAPYRRDDLLRAADVNFSAALSLGVMVAAGELTVNALENLTAIAPVVRDVASRVDVVHDMSLTMQSGGLGDVGIDMLRVLAQYRGSLGEKGEMLAEAAVVQASEDDEYSPTLDGADFTQFSMRFPARVTLRTTRGEEYSAQVDAPAGAAGRDPGETKRGVEGKFLRNAAHLADPKSALESVLDIDRFAGVRAVSEAICE